MGGIPMIGNPGVRVFYPPLLALILTPLPLTLVFAFTNILNFWIAGAATYGIARMILQLRPLPALFAALALMLTPRLSSNVVGDMGYTAGLCWVPLCILSVRLALDRLALRWAVVAGISLAILYILNFVFTLYLCFFCGIYCLFIAGETLIQHNSQRLLKYCGIMLVIGVLALGVAAFHLLPLATFLPHQARTSMTLADANQGALPLPFLINFVVPTSFKFPEWEAYIGLLVILLIPAALFHHQRRETRLWLFVLVFSILFSLGTTTPIYTLMVEFVPGFGLMRFPARMLYIVALAAALLGGLALEYLLTKGSLPKRFWRWLIITSMFWGLITLVGRFLTRQPGELDWLLGFSAIVGLILAVTVLWRWQGRNDGAYLRYWLLVALLLDLFPLAFTFAEPLPVNQLFSNPTSEMLPDSPEGELYRIFSMRRELPDHIIVDRQLQVVDGLNSFQFTNYSHFMREATRCNLEGVAAAVPPCVSNEISISAYRDMQLDSMMLGAMNVKYIVAPQEVTLSDAFTEIERSMDSILYTNSDVLPRAFAVGQVEVLSDNATVKSVLPDTNFRRVALISQDVELNGSFSESSFFQPATIALYTPNEIEARIDMPANGILVFGEVWTPGWRASVDGVETEVLRVNGALRGVYLPQGAHDITLFFVPPIFILGLIVSLSTLIISFLVLIVLWKRHHGRLYFSVTSQ